MKKRKKMRKEREEIPAAEKMRKEREEIPAAEKRESVAESAISIVLPGIGKLLSNLQRISPVFKKRLEETDAEIERRIAEGRPRRPIIDYNVSVRTLAPEKGAAFKPLAKKAEAPTLKPERKAAVDVFDEDDKIVIVMEMPGVKEKDISVEVKDNVVEISAGNYREKVIAPTKVSGKPSIKYKNGILEVRLSKKR